MAEQVFKPQSKDFLFVLLFNAIALAIVLPALPTTLQRLSTSLSESSSHYALISILFLLVYIIGSVQVGLLLDRIGRRLLLVITLLVNSIGFGLLVLPTNFSLILFARSLNGYGQISGNVIQASLSDLTPSDLRPLIFGKMNSVLAIAFVFGSLIAGVIAFVSDRESYLYVASLITSLCALFFAIRRCPETLRSEIAVPVVRLTDLFRILRGLRMGSFMLLLCFYTCNLGLLVIWPFYARYRFGWGAFESGLTLALLALAFAFSQSVVLPYCIGRFGLPSLLRSSIVSTSLFFLLLGLADRGILFMFLPFANFFGFMGVSLVQGSLSGQATASQQGALATLFALLSSLGSIISLSLFAAIMAFLSSANINDGLVAGLPFYSMALILPLFCLLRPGLFAHASGT